MRKHMKDAGVSALFFIIFKLVIKLITFKFYSLFEDGIWLGLGVIFTSYTIVFCLALLFLIVTRRKKSQSPTQVKE